jgi:hypothetical protein
MRRELILILGLLSSACARNPAPSAAASLEAEPAVVVILNRRVVRGLEELRTMQGFALVSVRRLSAAEVAIMTGTNAPAGGIELVYQGVSR